jgi:hypothetical protein
MPLGNPLRHNATDIFLQALGPQTMVALGRILLADSLPFLFLVNAGTVLMS